MRITITTGARLHFGLLSFGDTAGRQFGGLGAMIDRPGFVIAGEPALHDELVAPPEWQPRLKELLQLYRAQRPGAVSCQPVRIEVHHAPPAHAGFGSGTQLGLAVARLLSFLDGDSRLTATELAMRTGRGHRSAIGVHGFECGGLLLEAGKLSPQHLSPLVSRVELPEAWRFVLVRPLDIAGVSGEHELAAFSRLPAMSAATTDRLCSLAVRELIPAAVEHDCARFSSALWDYGTIVGHHFSAVQGGVFAHQQMSHLAASLHAHGHPGIAQTSWGPTICIVCRDLAEANRLLLRLQTEEGARHCELTVAAPRNAGADVVVQ